MSDSSSRLCCPRCGTIVTCGCATRCGDDRDTDGPGICKGLPRIAEAPIVEIGLVSRDVALSRKQEPS